MFRVNLVDWLGMCLVAVALLACEPTPAVVSAPVVAELNDAAKSMAVSPDGCAPIIELARMDQRMPVPLQPMMAWHQKQNMMEHLVAIQRITDALAREDWDSVAAGSALIESSPKMERMCNHMGAGADGFTELALRFHRLADKIGVAAKAKDGPAVLRATADTLQACTTCHATYKHDVVDAATWQERTGRAHDPAEMHDGHH